MEKTVINEKEMIYMKINHIHPIYSNEESKQRTVKKELKKVFTIIAARKQRLNGTGVV